MCFSHTIYLCIPYCSYKKTEIVSLYCLPSVVDAVSRGPKFLIPCYVKFMLQSLKNYLRYAEGHSDLFGIISGAWCDCKVYIPFYRCVESRYFYVPRDFRDLLCSLFVLFLVQTPYLTTVVGTAVSFRG